MIRFALGVLAAALTLSVSSLEGTLTNGLGSSYPETWIEGDLFSDVPRSDPHHVLKFQVTDRYWGWTTAMGIEILVHGDLFIAADMWPTNKPGHMAGWEIVFRAEHLPDYTYNGHAMVPLDLSILNLADPSIVVRFLPQPDMSDHYSPDPMVSGLSGKYMPQGDVIFWKVGYGSRLENIRVVPEPALGSLAVGSLGFLLVWMMKQRR